MFGRSAFKLRRWLGELWVGYLTVYCCYALCTHTVRRQHQAQTQTPPNLQLGVSINLYAATGLPVVTKTGTLYSNLDFVSSQKKGRATSARCKMQPKARPIQRFAQAVSKCTTEVGSEDCWLGIDCPIFRSDKSVGCRVRPVCLCRLQLCAQRQVRQGVHEAQGLLPGMNLSPPLSLKVP